jgi:hypothetical protein
MAYERIMSRLPDLGKPISVKESTTPFEILNLVGGNYIAAVALVTPNSLEGLKLHKFDGRSAFFDNLKGFEFDEKASSELVPFPRFTASDATGFDRVVCLIFEDGNVEPVNAVGSKYRVFQNESVANDGIELAATSGTSTEIMSAGTHRDRRLFSLTIGYEVLSTVIDGKEIIFNQYATLFTSHDSKQAYGLAYSLLAQDEKRISFWRVQKIKHTKKIEERKAEVKSTLLGYNAEGKSFIAEVDLMGKVKLDKSSELMDQLLEIAAVTPEGSTRYGYDRRDWEKKKIAWLFKSTSVLYGSNGWAFYQALNQFIFTHHKKGAMTLPITNLRESHYEAQNQVKKFLIQAAIDKYER